MTRADFLALLDNQNIKAFLRVIRQGESNQSERAYQLLYGGEFFSDFEDHPRIKFWEKADEFIKNGKKDYTTAAGAYQFVASSWDPLAKKYGLNDFGSTNQDIAAVALIHERGALDFVKEGRIREAIDRCSSTWASLPGSRWGQPTKTLEAALNVYRAHGGRVASDTGYTATVVDPPAKTVPTKEVKPMAPALILPLLEIAGRFLPMIAEKFSSGSEVANRNIAAGKVLGEAIVAATQATNLQEAVEKLEADPAARAAANAAVSEVWPSLFEVGSGGIDGARKAAASDGGDWRRVFISVPMVVILLLMPMVYFVVYHVVTGETWSGEIKASVVSAVISGVLFAIVGFALGTSYGSQKKDAMLGRQP